MKARPKSRESDVFFARTLFKPMPNDLGLLAALLSELTEENRFALFSK
jgi:hypothetical protein